jgi:hypothetical protein
LHNDAVDRIFSAKTMDLISGGGIDELGNVPIVETRTVSVASGHFMFASAAETGKRTGEAAAVREALKGKL